MKTKYILTLIAFILITNIFAQTSLNNYKYVIVPNKFDFFKEADKYQLNSLTKFLLEKENFTVFFDNSNLPEDLSKNRCLALFLDVLEDRGIFKTKLMLQLKNCKNEIVFITKNGSSKRKEYEKAYHEALRDAFQAFKVINYQYKPEQIELEVVKSKPIKELIAKKPIIKEASKEEVVKQKILKPVVEKLVINQTTSSNILYAQVSDSGFQVVDSTPKVVMILLNTPKQDVYIVKGEDAIVFKENGKWFKSKNANSAETLNLKF